MHVSQHAWRGQRKACRSRFFPSTVWILRIRLRTSRSASTKGLHHCTFLPAPSELMFVYGGSSPVIQHMETRLPQRPLLTQPSWGKVSTEAPVFLLCSTGLCLMPRLHRFRHCSCASSFEGVWYLHPHSRLLWLLNSLSRLNVRTFSYKHDTGILIVTAYSVDQGWRHGPAVKSTGCSAKGQGSIPSTHLSVTPVPGDPKPSHRHTQTKHQST